jgi:hypothetical protein
MFIFSRFALRCLKVHNASTTGVDNRRENCTVTSYWNVANIYLLSSCFNKCLLGMLRFTYFGLGVEQVGSVHSSLNNQFSICLNYMRLDRHKICLFLSAWTENLLEDYPQYLYCNFRILFSRYNEGISLTSRRQNTNLWFKFSITLTTVKIKNTLQLTHYNTRCYHKHIQIVKTL